MTYISDRISRNSVPFCVYFLSLALFVQSVQAAGSASTLPGQAPGAPLGSFKISELDTVNLFNGHLNFRLPLMEIGGRGQASYSLGLPIDHRWVLLPTSPDTPDSFNPGFIPFTSLTPGFLRARHLSEGCQFGVFFETQTHTVLVFTTPNGSQVELRDANFLGQPALSQCNQFDPGAGMANRGRTFINDDGSFIFISDSNIFDMTQAINPIDTKPSGYLVMKDGTRYRVSEGQIKWLRDRNGNLLTFTYESSIGRLTGITDSLNRQVTIAYTNFEPNPSHTNITYKGFGGAPRTINIEYANLSDLLVEGSITTYQGLFGIGPNDQFNPWLVKLVRLPDNRTYQLRYNKYGELSRVELPTGGVFTYQWASGNPQNQNGLAGRFVDRRVIKKSIYKDAVTLVGSTSFGLFETNASGTSGSVKLRQLNEFDVAITDEKHHFHGIPIDNTNHPFGYTAPAITGREYQTDTNTANGASLLRRVEHTFDAAGINIIQTLTTLADVSPNLIAKETFTYDGFNNLTDTYEYDFGSGSPGSFRRRTHIGYVTNATYTGTDPMAVYDGTAANLRSLPFEQWISSDLAGTSKKSLTVFEYDNYSVDTLHHSLTPRSNISGLCTTFNASGICSNTNPTSYTTRGNVTTITSYANASAQTGAVTIASQYDVAGNIVKAIDGRGYATLYSFSDCYGSPDDNAQNCGGATELGSQVSYAFSTTVSNPLNHIIRSQFDYYLGQPVEIEDANGVVTSVHYNDSLDRTKKIIRAANQGVSVRGQTLIDYDDANRTITTSQDLDSFDDKKIVSKVLYDGLGRTTESRQYESSTNFIVTKSEYDALSRPFKVSNPFRPWQSESEVWTTQLFDSLGRVISVTTPDNAVVSKSYSGNSVTVTDQAGTARKSVSDALGRLTQVREDPNSSDFLTTYEYDALDNLTKVIQDNNPQQPQQPPRVFAYDSLKRLTSATNPESGQINYQYDNNSNLTQKTDARGVVSIYVYDALNRNTTIDYSDSTSINPDVSRFYDGATKGKGRLWSSYAGGSESSGSKVEKRLFEEYDALGRPLVLKQFFKVDGVWSSNYYRISRAYNLAGGVTSQTYPSNRTVTYNYDSAGRLADKDLQSLAFAGNLGDGVPRTYLRGIAYTSGGQLKQEQFGTITPVYNKLFYNSRQQLAEILASTTGGDSSWNRGKILNQYSLQCSGAACNATDNNGNLRKQEVYIPGNDQVSSSTSWYQQYDYDALNRLLRVHEYTGNPALDWQQEYVYDRWGNRTIHQTNTFGTNIPKPNFGVNITNNRLTPPVGHSMNYDAAGNLTIDTYPAGGDREYDAENRMTKAWGNGQWQLYTYDADGHRTRRKADGQEAWQVYGFENELLAEYAANSASAAPQKEYGYRNGQLLVTAEPGGNTAVPLFADDFNDNSLDTSKWTVMYPGGNPPVTEESQQLKITLAPNTAGYNGVYSNSTYDLTGRMVQVEVVQAVSQAGWCENLLELELNANNYFLIDAGAGSLLLRARVNGVNDQTSIAFDPGAHRHWRIRHNSTANTINFETSADGLVWITRKTVTPAFSLTSLKIHLTAGAYGTGNSSPGAARYDSLKLLSSAAGSSSITVPNAGFETPALGFGNFQYGPTGGSWNFINGGGISAGGSGFTGGPFIPEGNQVAFLQSTGEFSQSLSGFQANTNYIITFLGAQRTNCCNGSGQDIAVYLDGTLLGTFHPPANGVYVEYSTPTFTTTAGTHTLKFIGMNTSGYTAFVDQIRLTGSPINGNGVQWLLADHLGTPRMVFDQSGSLANMKRHDYLPFGEELISQGLRSTVPGYTTIDGVRQQFASKERDDETGLDYFLARYYSSNQGRFTSPDPTLLSANGFNPQTWNRYAYVLNSPLAYVDPLGLWALRIETVYKTDSNGNLILDSEGRRIVDRVIVTAVRTSDNDTAASLAEQLGLTGGAAESFARRVGDGNNIRLSQQGGEVQRVFKEVEKGLKEQAKYELRHPDRQNQGPDSADCSETACRIAFPQQMFSTLTFSVQQADDLLGAEGAATSVQMVNLRIGDILRWADDRNNPKHFANFIFRNDEGVPVVFSKSGARGPYEIVSSDEIGTKYPGYGTIQGKNPGQTGYYRPRR